jgi:Tfp pilus assembly protein PilF
MGLIYLQQDKIEDAKKLFQQAVKINPKYVEAHYNLGSILFSQGKFDAALTAFRKAAESNSNYPNAYYGAGLVFLRQNRFSDAEQVLQYAKTLYTAQGNSQWAANADQLLQKARNSTP